MEVLVCLQRNTATQEGEKNGGLRTPMSTDGCEGNSVVREVTEGDVEKMSACAADGRRACNSVYKRLQIFCFEGKKMK